MCSWGKVSTTYLQTATAPLCTRFFKAFLMVSYLFQASFEQCSNIVLIVMNGESKPFGIDEKQILEMIAREQVKLVGVLL